jgi:putative membrane protein
MIRYILLFLKGAAMGAANVIPGVSGGTIAFITGIYERLINSIKSFDAVAARLVLKGRFREFAARTDMAFLTSLFIGIAVSILSLARLLEYLFCAYPILTLAFFFGLILSSIFLVGKQISRWEVSTVLMLITGTAIAIFVSTLDPSNSNDGFVYLVICGAVAMSSMILPGLSGSYVLLIMGNYLLVMSAIGRLDMHILLPVGIGAVLGLLVFTRLISWLFKRFKDATIGLLTGFVAGSLLIIWPWKETIYKTNENGNYINKKLDVVGDACREGIVLSYNRYWPEINPHFWAAIALIAAGALCVWGIERLGSRNPG